MGKRDCLVGLFLCGLMLSGCAQASPTPTPDLVATQVAVMKAAEATLTASAPTPTLTQTVTPTPRPSATSTSTPGPTATATHTAKPPTSTPTYTPTPIPAVVPDDWVSYVSLDGAFTLYYPPSWNLKDESVGKVLFDVDEFTSAMVVIHEKIECLEEGLTPEVALQCLSALFSDVAHSEEIIPHFRVLSKGTWDDSSHKGYWIDTSEESKQGYQARLLHMCGLAPPPSDSGVQVTFIRVGSTPGVTPGIGDSEKQVLTHIFRSVRLGPRPAPRVSPTPTATAEYPQAVVKQEGQVNVRSGPGTVYSVVGKLASGDAVRVTGRNGDGTWLEVRLPTGSTGWLASFLVELNMPAEDIPLAVDIPTPPPTPTPTPVPRRAGLHERQAIGNWEIQPERVHKEKAVYWYGDETVAMGNYAIVIVLARNLASGTDKMSRTLGLFLRDDKGRTYDFSDPLTTERWAMIAACWEFSIGPTPFTDLGPGHETPLLMLWDVAADVQSLTLVITDGHRRVEWDLGDFANIPPFKK